MTADAAAREDDALILDSVGQFLEREVRPQVRALEAADEYPREIADKMGLTSSAVAKHMNSSSTRGLVRYDREHGNYALARAN